MEQGGVHMVGLQAGHRQDPPPVHNDGIALRMSAARRVSGNLCVKLLVGRVPGNGAADDAFDLRKTYLVAITAYRANGGGELLTKGAGLTKEEIDRRIRSISDKDIRHYLTEYIRDKGTISPQPRNHWRFIPEEWVVPAIERDRKTLFG